jgi:hypothetical protein
MKLRDSIWLKDVKFDPNSSSGLWTFGTASAKSRLGLPVTIARRPYNSPGVIIDLSSIASRHGASEVAAYITEATYGLRGHQSHGWSSIAGYRVELDLPYPATSPESKWYEYVEAELEIILDIGKEVPFDFWFTIAGEKKITLGY